MRHPRTDGRRADARRSLGGRLDVDACGLSAGVKVCEVGIRWRLDTSGTNATERSRSASVAEAASSRRTHRCQDSLTASASRELASESTAPVLCGACRALLVDSCPSVQPCAQVRGATT